MTILSAKACPRQLQAIGTVSFDSCLIRQHASKLRPSRLLLFYSCDPSSTRECFVISGASDSDRWRQAEASTPVRSTRENGEVDYMDASSVQDFVRTVARVPDGTVILFLSMYQDSAGNKLLSHEVLARIAKEARVPVYNQTGTNVGWGIVGGVVFDTAILRWTSAIAFWDLVSPSRTLAIPAYSHDARRRPATRSAIISFKKLSTRRSSLRTQLRSFAVLPSGCERMQGI